MAHWAIRDKQSFLNKLLEEKKRTTAPSAIVPIKPVTYRLPLEFSQLVDEIHVLLGSPPGLKQYIVADAVDHLRSVKAKLIRDDVPSSDATWVDRLM